MHIPRGCVFTLWKSLHLAVRGYRTTATRAALLRERWPLRCHWPCARLHGFEFLWYARPCAANRLINGSRFLPFRKGDFGAQRDFEFTYAALPGVADIIELPANSPSTGWRKRYGGHKQIKVIEPVNFAT